MRKKLIWWEEQRRWSRHLYSTKFPAPRVGKVLLALAWLHVRVVLEQAQSWTQHANSVYWGTEQFWEMFSFKIRMNVWWKTKGAHAESVTLSMMLTCWEAQGAAFVTPDLSPYPGLLSDLNVLIFSLFSLPFSGDYAKKAHHVYSMFLTSLHTHLDSTWKNQDLWSNPVQSDVCAPPFLPLPFLWHPLMKFQSSVRSLC